MINYVGTIGKSDNVLDKLENLKEITNDKKVYEEASILETKYNKGKRNIIKKEGQHLMVSR